MLARMLMLSHPFLMVLFLAETALAKRSPR